MPSFYTLTSGATAQAQDVNQLINAMNGSAGNGIPISLTALNDSVNFALAVKNADPTNSRSLQVLRANNNVLLQADANGVIVSPDGGATTGQVLTVNATQTLTNKTFTSPHMTGPVVDSGGLTVTAGGVTVAAGGIALQSGNLALTTGQYLGNAGTGNARLRLKDLGTVAVNAFVTVEDVLGSLGLLVVTYGGGSVAGFLLTGGGHTTTLLFGDATLWSTVFGTAAKINVNWNTAQYMLENKTAGSNTFETMLFSTS